MKSTLIKMPVTSFRRIENPMEQEGKRMYIAVVKASDLATELNDWRGINPRDPSTTSGVAKKIAKSLEESPEEFFFKNRGITLLVSKVEFDNERNSIAVEVSDPKIHGLLDGGHTFRIVQDICGALVEKSELADAYVRLEILEGFIDVGEVVDIVEARNTSTQVKDQSLEELRGHFEEIKKVLANESYANRIAYREIELAEDGSKKDIDVKEILSYLICFDVEAFSGSKHPIIAYSSKGAVLDHFRKEENRPRLKKYLGLLPQILELRDLIYSEMPNAYHDATDGKFGKLTGVVELSSKKRSPVTLSFTGKESYYVIPTSFIYPVLASMRNLVVCGAEKCEWKRDPIAFFDTVKEELTRRLVEQAKEFRNPNKLGKDNATWGRCYDYVEIEVLKLKV